MYSRNHALGMSYVNRFVIEEESQFECRGVHGLGALKIFKEVPNPWPTKPSISTNTLKPDAISIPDRFGYSLPSRISEKLHILISVDLRGFMRLLKITNRLKELLKQFDEPDHMVTVIGSERLTCVLKEEYDKFYKGEGQIRHGLFSLGPPRYFVSRECIGDEIEDFFQRIKMKHMAVNPIKIRSTHHLFIDPKNAVRNFHISMLTEEKQNEMLIQQNSGSEFPDFRNDTKLSKNEQNYALSICFRNTYIKNASKYYKIIDPDSTALPIPVSIESIPVPIPFKRPRIKGEE